MIGDRILARLMQRAVLGTEPSDDDDRPALAPPPIVPPHEGARLVDRLDPALVEAWRALQGRRRRIDVLAAAMRLGRTLAAYLDGDDRLAATAVIGLEIDLADDEPLAVAIAGLLDIDDRTAVNGLNLGGYGCRPIETVCGVYFDLVQEDHPYKRSVIAALANAVSHRLPVLLLTSAPPTPEIEAILTARLRLVPVDGSIVHEMLALAFADAAMSADEFGFDVSALRLSDLRLAYARGTAGETLARLGRMAAARIAARTESDASRDGSPRLEDLSGYGAAQTWGLTLAADLADMKAGRITWQDIDRGLLLSGPSGVGKTLFARALARTCGVPLIAGSIARWQAKGHLGDMLAAMKHCFDDATERAPCILFIDEFDSVCDRGLLSTRHDAYWIQVVNAMLEHLDGVADRPGVVVLAACNHPERIDPALLRPGRLDQHIRLTLPTVDDLVGILAHQLRSGGGVVEVPEAGSLRTLAQRLLGSTGADVEQVVRHARRLARQAGRAVNIADIGVVLTARLAGVDRDQRRRIAVHEAGHAVLAHALEYPLVGLTLSVDGGSTSVVIRGAPTRSAALDQVTMLLAGRAAEEVLLGEASAGSGGNRLSDLATATQLLATLAVSTGLGSHGGLAWIGGRDQAITEAMQRPEIAVTIEEDLARCLDDARRVVAERRGVVDAIAARLFEREALSADELEALLADG